MIYYIQNAHYEAMGADDKLVFDKNDKIREGKRENFVS